MMYSRLYLNHGYSYIFTSCRTLIPYRNSNRRYYYEPNLRRNLKYRCRTGGCYRSQIRCCPISRRIDQRRPSVCRSYIPYTCRGRVHTHHGRSVPGYAARCRYRINNRTGRPCHCRRSKIHCKPRL